MNAKFWIRKRFDVPETDDDAVLALVGWDQWLDAMEDYARELNAASPTSQSEPPASQKAK